MIERNTTIGTAQQRRSAWVRCQESASAEADPAFPRKFMSELLDDELIPTDACAAVDAARSSRTPNAAITAGTVCWCMTSHHLQGSTDRAGEA
jgi:hypothetical protein